MQTTVKSSRGRGRKAVLGKSESKPDMRPVGSKARGGQVSKSCIGHAAGMRIA